SSYHQVKLLVIVEVADSHGTNCGAPALRANWCAQGGVSIVQENHSETRVGTVPPSCHAHIQPGVSIEICQCERRHFEKRQTEAIRAERQICHSDANADALVLYHTNSVRLAPKCIDGIYTHPGRHSSVASGAGAWGSADTTRSEAGNGPSARLEE